MLPENLEARQCHAWSGFWDFSVVWMTPRRTWRQADVVAQRPTGRITITGITITGISVSDTRSAKEK